MDGDAYLIKWVAIVLIGVMVCAAVAGAIDAISAAKVESTAMENGYVQKVIDGERLWVKADE